MSRKSDHSQSPVRSAQGESITTHEFKLCKLRRITSAREPLVGEQEQRKSSPVRRKLRKTHHSQNLNRLSTNVSPNYATKDHLSTEEKPLASQNDISHRTSKLAFSLCEASLDGGPTELLYSSPYEIPSSVFSSTTAPSCTSVPTTFVSNTSIPSDATIKNNEASETKEDEGRPPSAKEVPPRTELEPSIAFKKCCENGFQNIEDVIKMTPREQTLLPRSLYLAAQLAATPNVNYSEKYGFQAFCNTKWLSPRTIACSLSRKSSARQQLDIPDYLKEASHPLSDLRFLAKPWWLTISKNRRIPGRGTVVTKGELFADSKGSFMDSPSVTFTIDNSLPDSSDFEYEKQVDMFEGNTHAALPQKLISERAEARRNENRPEEFARNIRFAQVKNREIQTYITFPYYLESRVDFWSDNNQNNPSDVSAPLRDRLRVRELGYKVKTNTRGINTHLPDYQQVNNTNTTFEQTSSTLSSMQTLMNKPVTSRYFGNQVLGNVSSPYNLCSGLQNVQNSTDLNNYQRQKLMPPANTMLGTGDTAEKVTTKICFQNYFIPVLCNSGPNMAQNVYDLGHSNSPCIHQSIPNLMPCYVQPVGPHVMEF